MVNRLASAKQQKLRTRNKLNMKCVDYLDKHTCPVSGNRPNRGTVLTELTELTEGTELTMPTGLTEPTELTNKNAEPCLMANRLAPLP